MNVDLTIHYQLQSKLDDAKLVEQTVRQMRQLALDLPFEEVGDIINLSGEQCNTEARRKALQNGDEKDESLFWLLIQGGQHVTCPWNERISRRVNPTHVIAFNTWPGPGSEPANFGMCLYPTEIEWEYRVEDDERFQEKADFGYRFSWDKWLRHCQRCKYTRSPAAYTEVRKVPTKLTGWRWHSSCKTQYASDPECGGIPNFLRCHISVVTLLDRITKLPGLKVTLDDEGKYGRSVFSDDWKEAHAAGRKPTYRRHKGLYNPAALANEVDDWNTMIAEFAGALTDALAGTGIGLEAPIKNFQDFERLEFKGWKKKYIAPFLKAMKTLAKAANRVEQLQPPQPLDRNAGLCNSTAFLA